MNTIRFNDKDAFIAALEARRPFWREYDKRQEREHKAAEQKWLTDTRKTLRDAAKFDYTAMKEAVSYRGRLGGLDSAPSCPRLMEPKIDSILAALKHTQARRSQWTRREPGPTLINC
jgi:hypothetical protein